MSGIPNASNTFQVFSKYVNKWISIATPFQGNFSFFLFATFLDDVYFIPSYHSEDV